MNSSRYNTISAGLHWLTVVLVMALFSIAFYMEQLPREPGGLFSVLVGLHKSLGITVFLVMLLRLGWRWTHPAPAWHEQAPKWQCRIATGVHALLYLLLLLQPLSGYLSSSFSGYKTKVWGIALPHWGEKNEMLNELFSGVHEVIAWTLLTLITVHISAAIIHNLLVMRDPLRGRMPPFKPTATGVPPASGGR